MMRVDGPVVVLEGHCPIEEAETLLEAVQSGAVRSVDVGGCRSMHTAIVQVLLAAGLPLRGAMEDSYWQEFLSALPSAGAVHAVASEPRERRAKAARKRA